MTVPNIAFLRVSFNHLSYAITLGKQKLISVWTLAQIIYRKKITSVKIKFLKLIGKFDVMYSEALFFRKNIYEYNKNFQNLNDTNNIGSFIIVCIYTPEVSNISLLSLIPKFHFYSANVWNQGQIIQSKDRSSTSVYHIRYLCCTFS